ncbi:MAG: MOSC domain-containing protein, partial [Pyrinomonadaceae bacterium]
QVRTTNLDGDRQADLTVHGGPEKAVYLYPSEHYPFWRGEYPDIQMNWGHFGENLTTEGLNAEAAFIGDRFRIGSAEFMVTQPRLPCYKLAARFERDDILRRFLRSGRTGLYFSVESEGEIQTGDTIELLGRDESKLTVSDITNLYVSKEKNPELLARAVRHPALPVSWRDYFEEVLTRE